MRVSARVRIGFTEMIGARMMTGAIMRVVAKIRVGTRMNLCRDEGWCRVRVGAG